MPKYLFEAKYTAEGVRGLKEAGASSRAKAVNDMATGLGGSLESFYFAFGDVDAYVVVDLPDDEAAASAAFTVGASPLTKLKTVKLLTLEEADAAIARSVSYQPPGSCTADVFPGVAALFEPGDGPPRTIPARTWAYSPLPGCCTPRTRSG